MLNIVALTFFPAIMAFAAASDLLTMRISNRLVLALLLGFAAMAMIVNLPMQTLGIHLAVGLAVLLVSFTFFALGWIGGGDAKFAAATAIWLGWPLVIPFLTYAALLGGLLTLAILMARRLPLPAPLANVPWIDRLHDSRVGVPYGIALAAAGLITYSDTLFFRVLAV